MPDYLNSAVHLGNPLGYSFGYRWRHPSIFVATRKIAVSAIEITQQGWLHLYSLYGKLNLHGIASFLFIVYLVFKKPIWYPVGESNPHQLVKSQLLYH